MHHDIKEDGTNAKLTEEVLDSVKKLADLELEKEKIEEQSKFFAKSQIEKQHEKLLNKLPKNINIKKEVEKIKLKTSSLTKSQRDIVLYFDGLLKKANEIDENNEKEEKLNENNFN